MGRARLLLFAVAVLGLWLFSAVRSSSEATQRALKEAQGLADRAQDGVRLRVLSRRAQVLQEVLRVAQSPAYEDAVQGPLHGGAPERVNVQRFNALRKAVRAAIPEPEWPEWILGLTDASGDGLYASGDEEPSGKLPGLDVEGLGRDAQDGGLRPWKDELLVFFALPLAPSESTPLLLVGTKVLDRAELEELRAQLGLKALAISRGPQTIFSAGAPAPWVTAVQRLTAPGSPSLLDARSAPAPAPSMLTWLSAPGAPRWLTSRKGIPALPLDLLAVVPVPLEAAAGEQVLDSALIGGALVLLLVALATGSAKALPAFEPFPGGPIEGSAGPGPWGDPQEAPAEEPSPDEPGAYAAQGGAAEWPPPVEPGAADPEELPAEASPAEPLPLRPLAGVEAMATQPAYRSAELLKRATAAAEAEDDSLNAKDGPTMSGRVALPPEAYGPNPFEEGNESTRVMAVPNELIAASTPTEPPSEFPGPEAPPPEEPAQDEEEQHFQSVFQDFVATRQACGEPADGITFDKFALKLRKNREQLVQKLNCRTVRFQVYVKEGKAAIKASPVR